MAHYAEIDGSNTVVSVIVVDNAVEGASSDPVVQEANGLAWLATFPPTQGKTLKKTSYRTFGGVHADGGTPFRKNYAPLGGKYDAGRDAFYAAQPYPSWTLNEDTCLWEPPVPYPSDGLFHEWDEQNQQWVEV